MPPISYLRDDFIDNVESPTWGGSAVVGSATKAETSGEVRLTLPSSIAGTHQTFYRTSAPYDLTGDSFYINIDTMVATGVAATARFDLFLDGTNSYRWVQLSGTLKAQTIVDGVTTDRYSASWSGTTYKYLRIRESGGNILFDSSTNGTSWTNRYTGAAPFAVTALYVQILAECGNVASPGSFRIEDVNLTLPALSTTWHWTQVEWPLLYRFRSITLAATTAVGYIATSNDGTTWRYFSGPIGSSSGGYLALTEYATQAAAEAMAVNVPVDDRWDLPEIVECRFIRLYHRAGAGASYTLREYYPRRLVQSDDIEAESIRAINILAGTITADKIYATFTITGKTIQTNVGNPRAVMNGDAFGGFIGYGATDTYDPVTGAGTYQLWWSKTDGKLYAGGGNVVLSSSGIRIIAGSTYADTLAYQLVNDAGVVIAGFGATGLAASGDHSIVVKVPSIAGQSSSYQTALTAPSGELVDWRVNMTNATNTMLFGMTIDVAGSKQVFVFDGGGLDVGNTGATVADGNIHLAGNLRIANNSTFASSTGPRMYKTATGGMVLQAAAGSTYDFDIVSPAGSDIISVPTGTIDVKLSGKVGFNGTSPITKPTVTGSRAGNAALASLLTALSNYGLVVDSSSA